MEKERKISLQSEFEEEKEEDSYKVTFDVSSEKINASILSLIKYSRIIRDKLIKDNIFKELSETLKEYQTINHIKNENIKLFFRLLDEEEISINNDEFFDLSKLSMIFKVETLDRCLKKYLNEHCTDVDFILNLIIEEDKNKNKNDEEDKIIINSNISIEMESCLINNINECFQNPKFEQINKSIIYRLFESSKEINSSLLYEFICKSIEERYIFFKFVKIEDLPDKFFNEIFNNFENSYQTYFHYYQFLPNNLSYIKSMRDEMKNLKNRISKIENLIENERIQNNQKEKLLTSNSEMLSKKIEEKDKILFNYQKEKDELQQIINDNKIKMDKQKELLENKVVIEKQENEKLQKKLFEKETKMKELLKTIQLKTTITANVESNDTIKCCINIIERGTKLDKNRSKFIINQNNSQKLGEYEYKTGTEITKLNTEFSIKKPVGTYFVHAIIIDDYEQTEEFISNSLIIKPKPKSPINFEFTGRAQEITLDKGIYKLEVWGASGGENTVKCEEDGDKGKTYSGTPGKGGYSVGTLNLSKATTLYVYVGGSSTNHHGGWNGGGSANSPGAGGGGATDISLYSAPNKDEWNAESHLKSRIIVAGGGGGSGLSNYSSFWRGGCGGGENGEEEGSRSAIGGTQNTGYGFGYGGLNTLRHSSGGGGGWYGGGACNIPFGWGLGGGGGSGFVYNSSTASNYPSGCKLNSEFYLTDSKTISGNTEIPSPDGSGTEKGHTGNGYAKITFQ